MRLVHLSDLHLGFRQYQRLTPGGINQREADVARSFQTAIDRTIELRAELVLVGGDVFHNVRPTNPPLGKYFDDVLRMGSFPCMKFSSAIPAETLPPFAH